MLPKQDDDGLHRSHQPLTRWGTRAAALYDDSYADQYRAHDETLPGTPTAARLDEWLRGVCERFDAPIDVLDLGCGTGRYFHALANVRRLVGIDVSRPMLERARRPIGGVAVTGDLVTLVEGDFLVHDFEAGEFDLVYSIGVLAEHSPLDEALAARVARWLRRGGRFAFTAVHLASPSVPRSLKRRAAEWASSLAWSMPTALAERVRARLMSGGMYADEDRVRSLLAKVGLTTESIGLFESDVHLHVIAVARR
jgi:SAM-dependent methyltransferase